MKRGLALISQPGNLIQGVSGIIHLTNPQGDKANIGNCYGCGDPGHYKRNCPKLRAHTNSQGNTVSKRADSPATHGTDTGTNNKGDNNSKRNESRRVTRSQKVTDIKGGYVASGSIQGMPVDLLIESGSDVTLMDIEVYNQLPESVRPLLRETETNLSTASVLEKQGLIQPTYNLVRENGLFMGTALVDSSKQLVPISLINLDEEPIQLPKRYTVGVMEQVERAPPRDGSALPIPEDD